jgi:hypothetical protein
VKYRISTAGGVGGGRSHRRSVYRTGESSSRDMREQARTGENRRGRGNESRGRRSRRGPRARRETAYRGVYGNTPGTQCKTDERRTTDSPAPLTAGWRESPRRGRVMPYRSASDLTGSGGCDAAASPAHPGATAAAAAPLPPAPPARWIPRLLIHPLSRRMDGRPLGPAPPGCPACRFPAAASVRSTKPLHCGCTGVRTNGWTGGRTEGGGGPCVMDCKAC